LDAGTAVGNVDGDLQQLRSLSMIIGDTNCEAILLIIIDISVKWHESYS